MKKMGIQGKLILLQVSTFLISTMLTTLSTVHYEKLIKPTAAQTTTFYVMNAAIVIITLAIIAYVIKKYMGTLLAHTNKLANDITKIQRISGELETSSTKLSEASTQQAASIQESMACMQETSSMIAQTVKNAAESADLANSANQKAKEGGETMHQMVASMNSIKEANEQLTNMANIIAEISKKTRIINDIVFKTQLLSFNASIEAARAGQHGQGFAVVAEEVGNLAQLSGNAAKEISILLEDSKKQVNNIVASTQEKVQTGQNVSQRAVETFDDIVQDIERINGKLTEISNASKEQEQGIQQTTVAIAQMDQSAQVNKGISIETSELSKSIKTEGNCFAELVSYVNAYISGNETNSQVKTVQKTVVSTKIIKEPSKKTSSPRVTKGESIESDSILHKPLNAPRSHEASGEELSKIASRLTSSNNVKQEARKMADDGVDLDPDSNMFKPMK